MKRNESIDALSKRWYAGKTSDVEEQQLREAFLNPNDNTDSGVCDSRQLEALLFAGFRELAAEQMSESRQTVVGPSETTVPPADKRPALRIVRRPLHRIIWRAATVAAILVFGVVLGLQLREPTATSTAKPSTTVKRRLRQPNIWTDSQLSGFPNKSWINF